MVTERQACKLQAVTRFYRRIRRREQRESEITAVSAPQLHAGTDHATVGAVLQHETVEQRMTAKVISNNYQLASSDAFNSPPFCGSDEKQALSAVGDCD